MFFLNNISYIIQKTYRYKKPEGTSKPHCSQHCNEVGVPLAEIFLASLSNKKPFALFQKDTVSNANFLKESIESIKPSNTYLQWILQSGYCYPSYCMRGKLVILIR